MSQWTEHRIFVNLERTAQLTVCCHVDTAAFAEVTPLSKITEVVQLDCIGDRSEAAWMIKDLNAYYVGKTVEGFLSLGKITTLDADA